MIRFSLLILGLALDSYQGYAAHYSPGLMTKVALNRGMTPQACMVASPHEPIGTWLRVTSLKTGATRTCMVVDVPQTRHRASIIRRGIVVELDFTSAKHICGIRRVNQEPPKQCPVIVRTIQ